MWPIYGSRMLLLLLLAPCDNLESAPLRRRWARAKYWDLNVTRTGFLFFPFWNQYFSLASEFKSHVQAVQGCEAGSIMPELAMSAPVPKYLVSWSLLLIFSPLSGFSTTFEIHSLPINQLLHCCEFDEHCQFKFQRKKN